MTICSRNLAILVAAFGALVAVLWVLDSRAFYAWQQERMVKRVLAVDPHELLSSGRALIASRQGVSGRVSPSSSSVPQTIRRLKPTLVSTGTNWLSVDFSDASNPFGIIIYADGVSPPPKPKSGIGPRQWIDGLWLYDDGQLETYGLEIRAAAGSDLSVSNQTNAGAGIGRLPSR